MKELVLFSFRDCFQQDVRDIFVCVHKVPSFCNEFKEVPSTIELGTHTSKVCYL